MCPPKWTLGAKKARNAPDVQVFLDGRRSSTRRDNYRTIFEDFEVLYLFGIQLLKFGQNERFLPVLAEFSDEEDEQTIRNMV